MRGFRPNDVEDSVAKNEFLLHFNRLYASQRYVEAYDWCLQNLKTSYGDEAKRKAASCCPKLTKRIELSKMPLTYDDIIDVFVPLKYKMKITPNGLRVSTVYFKLTRELGKTVVAFKRPWNFWIILLTLFGVFLMVLLIIFGYAPLNIRASQYYQYLPVAIPIMVIIGLIPFYYLYRMFRSQNNIIKYFTNALIK